MMEEHKNAHGLSGCVRAWCGIDPEHQHRSDGDAYATMLLMQAVCQAKHVDPEMMVDAYPECVGESLAKERVRTEKRTGHGYRRKRRRRRTGASANNVPKTVGE